MRFLQLGTEAQAKTNEALAHPNPDLGWKRQRGEAMPTLVHKHEALYLVVDGSAVCFDQKFGVALLGKGRGHNAVLVPAGMMHRFVATEDGTTVLKVVGADIATVLAANS